MEKKTKNLIRIAERHNRYPRYRLCLPLAVRKDSSFVVGGSVQFIPNENDLYIESTLYGYKIFYMNGKKTSVGIHIPRPIAERLGFSAGDLLEIQKINENKLLIKRSQEND